jgi:hypothetical protein
MTSLSCPMLTQALFSHGGTKLHCITLGADGMLYSGGDDALIRRWRPILSPAEDFLAALEPAHVRNGVSDSVEQIQQVGGWEERGSRGGTQLICCTGQVAWI